MREFDEFYYSTVCHVCKRRPDGLKRCGGCGLYRYCSREHQRRHWPAHARLCGSARGRRRPLAADGDDWREARLRLKALLERGLRRPLTPAENQVWMFPRSCAVCRLTDDRKLFDCPSCPAASYCSVEHREAHAGRHSLVCSAMRLQHRYYCAIADSPDGAAAALRTEDRVSYASTLFSTAERFRAIGRRLVVHAVGATRERDLLEELEGIDSLAGTEEVALVLVGPELDEFPEERRDGRPAVEYRRESVLYSEYVSSERFEAPDVVVAFNCGLGERELSEADTWRDSLRSLTPPGALFLMTSYTRNEAIDDLRVLLSASEGEDPPEVLVRCEENPHRGSIPLRDWTDCDGVYYNNYYYSVLRRKLTTD